MRKGEFELIEWIKEQFEVPEGILGIGDDCAVLPQKDGVETLVTTDMLVEGVHFLLEDVDPYSLGWKSAAVNISDIAGMGGRPTGTFLSVALPKRIEDGFLKEFIRGYKAVSERFACPLLGGDTTASKDKLCISVTVLGECEAGRSRKRSAAQPGDLICVTGPLGDSAAGLKVVLERVEVGPAPGMTKEEQGKKEETPETANGEIRMAKKETEMIEGEMGMEKEKPEMTGDEREITKEEMEMMKREKSAEEVLRERHYRPMPRVTEGQKLAVTPGVNAMMDISDGIGSDLRHILEASGTGARVDVRRLPLSTELRDVCARRGWDPAALAADGGEDYELLFTCRPGTVVPVPYTVIGEILAAPCDSGHRESIPQTATDESISEKPAQDERGKKEPSIIWEGTDRDFTGFHHF